MMKRKVTKFSLFALIIAAFTSFNLSYNMTVISGALLFIIKEFQLTTFQQEWVVSILLVGALIGALSGGFIADFLGRKKVIIVTLFLFLIGSFCLITAQGLNSLLISRLISGFSVGIASVVVPLYIFEISPSTSRGVFFTLSQLLNTVGTLIAYIASYYYAQDQSWKGMFKLGLIPLLSQLSCLFFIPETPLWLLKNSTKDAAEKIWRILGLSHLDIDSNDQKREEDVLSKKQTLFGVSVRRPFLIGIGISIFQQLSGTSAVMIYAPQIFQMAGYKSVQTAMFLTIFIGIINMLFTFLAFWLIDRFGRKPILIGGFSGMALAFTILGFSFFFELPKLNLIVISCLILYVAFYAASLAIVTTLVTSEIFPPSIRGPAMGIATGASWMTNYLVCLTFLTLLETFGSGLTFWFYAAICSVGFYFCWKIVPETKVENFKEIPTYPQSKE